MLNWSGATRATRIDVATHIVVGGPLPDKVKGMDEINGKL